MTDIKTAYAISSGCYSDYRVHIIFEKRCTAVAFLESHGFIKHTSEHYPGSHWWAHPSPMSCDGKFFVGLRYEDVHIEEFEYCEGDEFPMMLTMRKAKDG
jgi:hypothetical protein